jgi:hypothetical protein
MTVFAGPVTFPLDGLQWSVSIDIDEEHKVPIAGLVRAQPAPKRPVRGGPLFAAPASMRERWARPKRGSSNSQSPQNGAPPAPVPLGSLAPNILREVDLLAIALATSFEQLDRQDAPIGAPDSLLTARPNSWRAFVRKAAASQVGDRSVEDRDSRIRADAERYLKAVCSGQSGRAALGSDAGNRLRRASQEEWLTGGEKHGGRGQVRDPGPRLLEWWDTNGSPGWWTSSSS